MQNAAILVLKEPNLCERSGDVIEAGRRTASEDAAELAKSLELRAANDARSGTPRGQAADPTDLARGHPGDRRSQHSRQRSHRVRSLDGNLIRLDRLVSQMTGRSAEVSGRAAAAGRPSATLPRLTFSRV